MIDCYVLKVHEKPEDMHIFVTGPSGVLGEPVIRLLVEAGHQVPALSRSPGNTDTIRQLGAQPITANLFERDSLIKILAITQADAIIHLATRIPPTAHMGTIASWQENDHIRRDGTRALVDAALASGVQTLVYPSSYYVYPDHGSQWIDALSTPVTAHVIQQTTLDAEVEVGRFTKAQRRGGVLRMGALYGPDVPSAMALFHLAEHGIVALLGAGDAYLSYIWRDDAARAIAVALTEAPAGIYDIVDDEPLTRVTFASALAHTVGRRRLFRLSNGILTLLMDSAADMANRSQRVSNRQFKGLTSWKPAVPNAGRDGR